MGVVFVTIYTGAIHKPFTDLLGIEADLANTLIGNFVVYLISFVVMYLLIRRVKKVSRGSAEAMT